MFSGRSWSSLRAPVVRAALPVVLFAGLATLPALADDEATHEVGVDSWLVLGPVDWPLPFVGTGEHAPAYGAGDLVGESLLELPSWPADGESAVVGPGRVSWQAGDGTLAGSGDVPHVAWTAAYVHAERFAEVTVQVTSAQPLRVLLDGAQIAARTTSVADDTGTAKGRKAREAAAAKRKKSSTVEAEVALTPGKHLLLVQTVRDPEGPGDWRIEATVSGVPSWATLTVDVSPRHVLGLADLLDNEIIRDLDLSPDGGHVATSWASVAVPAEHRRSWVEIRSAEDGAIVRDLGDGADGFAWSPDGGRYVYAAASPGQDGQDLWIASMDPSVPARRLVRNVENWAGHEWTPDGAGLVVLTTESIDPDERGFKRYRNLTDRWTGARDPLHAWLVPMDAASNPPIKASAMRRLTVGSPTDLITDIGNGRLLMLRVTYGQTERPYYLSELVELDWSGSEDGRVRSRTVVTDGWVDDARYLDPNDSSEILVVGSPALFDNGGHDPDLPAGVIANDYESELYLVSADSFTALTGDWDPTPQSWHVTSTGDLWLTVQVGSYTRLARWDRASGELGLIDETPWPEDADLDVTGNLDISADGARLVFTAQGPTDPPRAFVADVDPADHSLDTRLLAHPAADAWERVDFGEVESWSFTMDDGTTVEGRINYPPDFDASKKYPLIVSYYGGTSPSSRSFGGRYPRGYWAAHGFVVYTLQPSGTTGYGQEYSARHVNAWGRRTGDEIIEGTKQFLAAHDFVDPENVGCIGASYGGFMTLYLVSHSDLFAAAISHAGISNLSSYWGKGWWGYLYSAAASAESFPWNARDLYVEQSPLYHADKIQTPLLLLHGDQDTNVPPSESHQMYTALRVLGRDVELIEVGGENHQIFFYPKRKIWMETIVAYFAMHLQERPEWWQHLWGTESEPKG